MKAKKKLILELFDRLELTHETADGSAYEGKEGDKYYFKPSDYAGQNKPVKYVYRNHKYFSGLFATKREGSFSGDFLDETGQKVYVFFAFKEGNKVVEILTKVQTA